MKSPLRKLLWTVFGLLLTLVLAVVAFISWLFLADLGTLKPQIETYVGELSGFEFRIEGSLSIDVGEHSTVVAENVSLRHVAEETAEAAAIATVARLEARVNLRSLFVGPIRVELVDLDGARIHLTADMLASKRSLVFAGASTDR